MVRAVLLLVLASAVGCGGQAVAVAELRCALEGIGEVYSSEPIDCAAFSENIKIAREMMVARGVAEQSQLPSVFGRLEIYVIDAKCIEGSDVLGVPMKGCEFGEYSETSFDETGSYAHRVRQVIRLNQDGKALGHELMHRLDSVNGRYGLPAEHPDWEKLGYFSFADAYWHSAKAISPEEHH